MKKVALRCGLFGGGEIVLQVDASETILELRGKRISSLPPEIGLLQSLEELYLSGNKLSSLPPEIGRLHNLRVLHLLNNQLTSLPPEIGRLTNLRELLLTGNELTGLPAEICNLGNLETLHLANNELVTLPSTFCQLLSLKELHVYSNPFKSSLIGNSFSDPRLQEIASRAEEINVVADVLAHMRFLGCEHDFKSGSVRKSCELCGKKFKGILKKKGMVCTRCGGMVHEDCATKATEMKRKAEQAHGRAEEAARNRAATTEVQQKATEKREERSQEPPAQASASDHSVARSTAPPTSQSSVADVCNWLGTIGLGALAKTFVRNDISGAILLELSETDLEKMGVSSLGQRKTLLTALRSLQQAAPSPAVSLSPAASAHTERAAAARAPLPPRSAKFVAPESESVTYKGLLELPDSYKPQGTCAQELLAARAVLGSKVPQLELIVKEVGSVSWSILAGQTAQELVKTHGLTEQEVFAIVAYTYDLGLSGVQSENLYFQLNELLRRRVADEMRAVMGFLYFILGALRKLPAFEGTVFRGNNSPGMVASEYTTGREIFWSGFTSTTTDLAAALDFAGRDGVVFRIKINSGRSIAKLSVMQRENEVLLPPNACLIVFSEMHREADGVQYVDLVEKKDSFRW